MQCRLSWLRISLLMVCLVFLAAGVAAQEERGGHWDGTASPIADIAIQINDPRPDGPDWPALARALINLKPGDAVTAERLEQAVSDLAPLALVQADVAVGRDGLKISFQLTPFRQIKNIDIKGNYPLLERDVRNTMTVAEGGIFRAEDMPEQEAAIARRYRDEGYIDPQVHITWDRKTDGHYHVRVVIDKGPHRLLEEIRLRGNRSIGDTALKARMSSWRWSVMSIGRKRFTQQRLDEDIRHLTAYYRERGFADVVIEADTFIHDRQVTCELTIREGPHYQIDWAGNSFFSKRKLRQDLVLFEVGNRGNIGLRRSINQIRRRYLQAGFAEAQVRWHEPATQIEHPSRNITIEIKEGLRHIVEKITIAGHHRIDEATVREQMLTRTPGTLNKGVFVAEVLREDAAAIGALYHSRGFLGARVSETINIDEQSARVHVHIDIAEGPQTRVGEIAIDRNAPAAPALLRQDLRLKPGEPYTPSALQEDEDTLAALISPLGYPYVEVHGADRLSEDRNRADVRFTIAPGPHVRVGQIFFVGNFKTREEFMHREMGFDPGDDFSLQEVLNGLRNLRNLNIFETVQVHSIGLKEKQETVHLLVRAAEKEPYYFLAGGGYQTDKGFFGRTQVGDQNFAGTAKNLSLKAEYSQVGYRAEIGIGDPRLLGSSIRADAAVFIERSEPFNQDFGTDTSGARLSFSRDWGTTFSTGLGVRYERREQFIREETAVTAITDPAAFDPRSIVVATPSVSFDSRDSFIRPRRGQLIGLSVDVSQGLDNDLDDFLKYRIETRTYHTFFQRVTLAGRAWFGYIEPYGGEDPPLDQLFFLGGTNTVRGFKENLLRFDAEGNPIGGRLAFAAGLEARIHVGGNFELVPFVDTGSVRQSLTEGGSDSLRWSTGLGLQYLTPIGPIGLFYGHKLDRRPGESNGRWHLSVGYTF